MNIDSNIISFDNSFREQQSQAKVDINQQDKPSTSRVHLNFRQLKEMKKNSLKLHSVESLSFYEQQQPKKVNELNKQSGLIFRFFKVFQKKLYKLKKKNVMPSVFENFYQDLNSKQNKIFRLKPDIFLFDSQNFFFQINQWIKCILLTNLLIIVTYLWCFCELSFIKIYNLDIVITLLNAFDILSQFNLAKIIKGQIIYDRAEICKNYIKNQFFEDLIFGLSFLIVIETEQAIFLFTFYISGVSKLFKIIHQLEDRFDLNFRFLEVVKLAKLLFLLNFLSHFIACIWIKVGNFGIDDEKNWISQQKIQGEPQYIIYISSFYWAVTTMVTVGYGDITPQNYLEKIVCIFVIILSCGVYGYSLNIIGQIVWNINQQTDKLDKKIRTLNKYFRYNNIEEKLQSRIKSYLEYKLIEQEQQDQNVYAILDELPKQFKQSIINSVFQEMLKNCPILNENFSKQLLQKSSRLIKPKQYQADDYIIDQNNCGEASIYFIDSGQVQLYEQQSKVIIKELSKGEFFGEYEFFTNQNSRFSLKCKTNATIFILKRSDFISILHKDDFEIFHSLKYQFEFHIPIKRQQKCLACDSLNHQLDSCKNIFYIPDVSKLFIRKENLKQFRSTLQRNKQKSKFLAQIVTIQLRQLHFLQDCSKEYNTLMQQMNEGQISDSYPNFSILHNIVEKLQENRELCKFREPDKKEYLNQKSKQSQSQNESTFVHNQKKPSYFYINQYFNENNFDIDGIKDYNTYFRDNNAELVIKRYNRTIIQNSLSISRKRRLGAQKYIEL